MSDEASDDEPLGAHIASEEQFWDELEGVIASADGDPEQIDDALRSVLELTAAFQEKYLQSELDFARCGQHITRSEMFEENRDYVLRQLLGSLLEDDDVHTLHVSSTVLLLDGRENASFFETMLSEGAFPRLVKLIRLATDDDKGLHRTLLQLLYEMSRVQRLARDDLVTVDDAFVEILFELIEQLANDINHPYHAPVIGVVLVLNEQYMCSANDPGSPGRPNPPLTNRILKVLSVRTRSFRTFGQNLVLVLNREMDLSPQLLILKLLYLLFTTPSTYEYFYTNDLYVIVDVFIRNLLNLEFADHGPPASPADTQRDGQRALIHTYLRVLCPLLKNTQIAREESQYKRNEVRRLLNVLAHRSAEHFGPVDETVIRLVLRCKQIEWLHEEGDAVDAALNKQLEDLIAKASPTTSTAPPSSGDVAKKLLGMSIADDRAESALSVTEVAAKVTQDSMTPSKAVRVKPAAPPPRRRTKLTVGRTASGSGPAKEVKVAPSPPPSR